MTELITKPPFRSSYVIDGNSITLELYRLLSIFYSSKKFASINNILHNDPVAYLLEFQEPEITRILTSSAISARIVDDRDEKYLNDHDTICGDLISNLNNPKSFIPLSLREACNKIIHATKIHYDVLELETGLRYLNPTIYYYGKFKGKDWKAILNIEKYVFNYVTYIAKFN